ncbi:MAG TPA: BamA/TamA family outer membrane protein [Chitinophagaceae bacterium]|nr:BamA/TamA family outer membrane protein [Chitinophagaceae bacterium]
MVIRHLYFYSTFRNFMIAALCLVMAGSCTIVKNYPHGKPFVYKTNININGNFSSDTTTMLSTRLRGQLDDSMRARSVSKLLWKVMKKPPVYDSANADKSIIFMRALLVSMGYFRDTITYKAVIDTVSQDQYRTTVSFNVTPGKPTRLDSISYNIKQQDLQNLAVANQKESFLKKGEPFAKTTISLELDRLTELYRNNGYLRFGRDLLQGLWDTVDVSFFDPNLDPFQQVEMLQKLEEQRKNPTADLEIRLKPGFDSSRIRKYFVGNIKIYPDYNQDTADYSRKETMRDDVRIIYYRNLFKPKVFPPNIYLHHGKLYDQRNYFKTINRFNSLGAWRLVNIEQLPRKNQDTVDITIRLTPAKKFGFTANLEGSLNYSAISGNLAGFNINFGLQNRNLWKLANQSSTSIRYGIETGKDTLTKVKFTQTRQFSFSHSIYFPRAVAVSNIIPKEWKENARTVLSFNAAATERRALFNLTTVNGSWGYELQRSKQTLALRFPNFEYSYLKHKPLLDTLFSKNPALKNIFTDGFIASTIVNYTISGGKKNYVNFLRANMEVSGLVLGLIRHNKFLDTNLYRFIKVDAEFIRKIVLRKSAVALRAFAGVGYEFNSTVNPDKKNNLPFFKEYFAGGPNSMRAWALRKLGPGSTVKSFGLNPERYGDVQLEANIEYRFPITSISGVKLNGALFTDMGNVWYLKIAKAINRPPEEVFNFSRLWKDIAIGAGVGLRIDLSFFVIRLDYSYKVKNPSPEDIAGQNKWFYNWDIRKGQFQLGIGYPFIL